jgi:ABC-type Fe3+-hydroxamate transport system substrate-binding protein
VTSGRRPRVVSLVPSATETLLALGADVAACTRFCNQPAIRSVGGTKNPDVAAIAAMRPDCVVLDTEENRREDAAALRAAGLELLVTSVRSLGDAKAVVGQLAKASGTTAPGWPGEPDVVVGARRTAFVPIWRRPWMTIGTATYGASLLGSIGIDVVAFGADTDYPAIELADIAASDADVVAVPSEPYSFGDDHVAELAAALPRSHVVRVDGEDLFWWGIRTPTARLRLAAALSAR